MALPVISSNLVFEQSISDFSFSIYGAVNKTENDFISPYSISAALLLLMLGTDDTTKTQMMSSIFKGEYPTNVHQSYKVLNDKLLKRTESGVTLAIANRLFGSQMYSILESYTRDALQYYGSELELLDFRSQPEQSRVKINDWVSTKTMNKIRDIIPRGVLNRNTVVVLANAIYFKGTWKTKFNSTGTSKQNFFVNTLVKQVDMMYGKFEAPFGVNQELNCKVLQLPYTGNKLSMTFILPNDKNGLAKLENQLTRTTLNGLINNLWKQEIEIRIPKFVVETEYDLIPILKRLGITEIFNDSVANFSRIVTSKGLYVSDARHKAYIEVNEEGTEAAAATTIVTSWRSSVPTFPTFVADHPFLFIIQDNETGTILFMGRLTNP